MNRATDPFSFFVTGTDTGTGKTHVSAAFCGALSALGTTSYFKPVQTGCERGDNGQLRAPDADYVFSHAPVQQTHYSTHVPYCYESACSPHLAASRAGEIIDIDRIAEAFDRVREIARYVVVEGAGGLCVPICKDTMMIDLIVRLGIPALLVTSPRLGTLNHTLLSLEALRRRNIALSGLVYNNSTNAPRDFVYEDNLAVLSRAVSPAPVCELSFGQDSGPKLKSFCLEIVANPQKAGQEE